jgi:tetratricopeptide (TPR) repeat protein
MNSKPPYPEYIRRDEERQIRKELEAVKSSRRSRVMLLYGSGGVGKTSLVRHMAEASTDSKVVWLNPIDVDDSEYWLLSNLETRVAEKLDTTGTYFADYREQLSQLPSYTRADISHETIVSYLGRVKGIFAQCYQHYVEAEDKTVVIVFDTVETIRGTNLLLTLTQWMKALPKSTLFILSGRPFAADGRETRDPIEVELASPYQGIPVVPVDVGGFSLSAAQRYIENSQVADDLLNEEKDKLIYLTRGQPLWLAFTIEYLRVKGIPAEAEEYSLDYIQTHIPYAGSMSPEGRRLHQDFLRRLVAPYRDSDFWHEAIKRLAVVRQPISRPVWEKLMQDLPVPDDSADMNRAWRQLLRMPWVRARGNGRYVALHDAVAEAFAQYLFPLHDQSQQWRRRIWRRALEIYNSFVAQAEDELAPQLHALDEELKNLDMPPRDDGTYSLGSDSGFISRSVVLDVRKRDLDQLKAAALYYLFLANFEEGCQKLLEYFAQAEKEHDVFIQDLLALYLHRFLPGGTSSGAFNDVIKLKLDEFRRWLTEERPDYWAAIGAMAARYLIQVGQPEAALRLLDQLPRDVGGVRERHSLDILRGNACMRIPSKVREGLPYFERALAVAEDLEPPDRHKYIAEAYKECGFYYRNIGLWQEADLSYERARNAIVANSSPRSSDAERDEMASIHTNWAYVKGLRGYYGEGVMLADTAITVRRRIGGITGEGISWSVCGEVYRYAKRFEKAWLAYSAAEQLLQGRRNWNWLGLIYQEKAICLHQALQDDIKLVPDPVDEAKNLIKKALDICLSHSIRAYPSALNRAGRIFSEDDPDQALQYLEKGIAEAHRLSDGWFWFANLIEYTELCYRVWIRTRDHQYLRKIAERTPQIDVATSDYRFPDLAGRWRLLQGHLDINDYLRTREENVLKNALENYKSGFANVALRPVGSSGAASIPAEFKTFERLFRQLPLLVREDWQTKLKVAWRDQGDGSTLLLARLQELY